MTKFKIERGIQRTGMHGRYTDAKDWPLEQMEIGDSYFIPTHGKDALTLRRLKAVVRNTARRRVPGIGLAIERAPEGDGLRVFRIEPQSQKVRKKAAK